MGGEKEGNPETKTSDYPVRFVIVATDSLINLISESVVIHLKQPK